MDHHSFRDWNVLKRLFCTFYIRKVGTTTAINHAILLRVKNVFTEVFFSVTLTLAAIVDHSCPRQLSTKV